MAMHAIEKLLARACGRKQVERGEVVVARVDFAQVNDLYLQTLRSFSQMGGTRVWDKERVAFVFDHYAPCPTIKSAAIHREMRQFAFEQGLCHHFDINAGVCHQVMAEAGLALPGSVVVATDSHTTTHGAFGAFGTGVGATDMAAILITGKLWLRVPEIMEVRLEGCPPRGVYPKDAALRVLKEVRADGAVYKGIAFTGSYVEELGVSGRMVLCNMAVEMGAKTAYIQPNAQVLEFVKSRAAFPYEAVNTDGDYIYTKSVAIDVCALSPQVAAPHSVDNVTDVSQVAGRAVQQGFIGSCTGGRLEDIGEAAAVLRGKKLPRGSRLLIIPASAQVMGQCMDKGYIQTLMDAGATFSTPGCGPCLGAHQGVLAPGETAICASNRNFPGRMGSSEAQIYLASPATVAASLLRGVITDAGTLEGAFAGEEHPWKN